MAETTSLKDQVVRDPTGSVWAMARKSVAGFATVAAVIAIAGCSSDLSARSSPTGSASTSSSPSTTTTPGQATTSTRASTTVSSESSTTEAAVLNAWESAQQTLYRYMDQPWPQDRADLVAGENTADLWPDLADYFSNPALQSEGVFLIGMKTSELNGPSSYSLRHAVVMSVTATTATVTGCISDTGTTTVTGAPGPATLDGGVGSSSGWWDLELLDGSWRITTFEETLVSRC